MTYMRQAHERLLQKQEEVSSQSLDDLRTDLERKLSQKDAELARLQTELHSELQRMDDTLAEARRSSERSLEDLKVRLEAQVAEREAEMVTLKEELNAARATQKQLEEIAEAAEREAKNGQQERDQERTENLLMASEELLVRQVDFALEKRRLSGALEESRRTLRSALGMSSAAPAAADSKLVASLERQLSEEKRRCMDQERQCIELEISQRRAEDQRDEAARKLHTVERQVTALTEALHKAAGAPSTSEEILQANERSAMACAENQTVKYVAGYQIVRLQGALDEVRHMLRKQQISGVVDPLAVTGYPR